MANAELESEAVMTGKAYLPCQPVATVGIAPAASPEEKDNGITNLGHLIYQQRPRLDARDLPNKN